MVKSSRKFPKLKKLQDLSYTTLMAQLHRLYSTFPSLSWSNSPSTISNSIPYSTSKSSNILNTKGSSSNSSSIHLNTPLNLTGIRFLQSFNRLS